MNLTFANMNGPAAQAKAPAPAAMPTSAAAIDAGGAADARPAPAADALQQSAPQPTAQPAAQPALAFAQWLGLEQIVPAAADAADAAAAPDGTVPNTESAAEDGEQADAPLLAAMAIGIAPMPPMHVTQAMLAAVSALPGAPLVKDAAPAVDSDAAPAPASAHTAPAAPRAAASLPATGSAVTAAPAAASNAGAAPALPAETLASTAAAAQDGAAVQLERGAANTAGMPAPATTGNAQRTADSVTLSGPPAAWRQTLQEALGDRLQLQLGKNAEQAVIRLEPPMLGRVEIAIRHSAGALEVHISATHGEVLRQLQTVGENLRNDLAGRQFTDVAVNIAQAPRGAGAGNMNQFAGDGSGRGRHQDGRQQEQDPGNALAEANTGASPFSLNGRTST